MKCEKRKTNNLHCFLIHLFHVVRHIREKQRLLHARVTSITSYWTYEIPTERKLETHHIFTHLGTYKNYSYLIVFYPCLGKKYERNAGNASSTTLSNWHYYYRHANAVDYFP